jgi:leader peptidase (prepilin peptidase)/N-methyltransferase
MPAVLGMAGLLVGGLIHRVVERLPRQMERAWWADIAAELVDPLSWARALGTERPAACAHVAGDIAAALARTAGRRASGTTTARRLAAALATGGLFAAAAWRFGAVPSLPAWCVALALLVALALIDLDAHLLPDALTLSLLWAGLVAATLHWTIPLSTAVWGAVAGFLALWIFTVPFKWVTGREGMAPGDFKLLAALGAWLGWQAILPVALIACVVGAIAGLVFRATGRREPGDPIPFGPFLAGGGVVTMLASVDRVLKWVGLS